MMRIILGKTMTNIKQRIDNECKMIAEFDQKLADIWRFLIMFGGEGFRRETWETREKEFAMYGIHWRIRPSESWQLCHQFLYKKYDINYSWKSIEETKP